MTGAFTEGGNGAIVADNGEVKAVIACSTHATWLQFKRMGDGGLHGPPVFFGGKTALIDAMGYSAERLWGKDGRSDN